MLEQTRPSKIYSPVYKLVPMWLTRSILITLPTSNIKNRGNQIILHWLLPNAALISEQRSVWDIRLWATGLNMSTGEELIWIRLRAVVISRACWPLPVPGSLPSFLGEIQTGDVRPRRMAHINLQTNHIVRQTLPDRHRLSWTKLVCALIADTQSRNHATKRW